MGRTVGILSQRQSVEGVVIEDLAASEAAFREENAALRDRIADLRLANRKLLALLNLAMTNPDRWPKYVARLRREHRQIARDVVARMFDEATVSALAKGQA